MKRKIYKTLDGQRVERIQDFYDGTILVRRVKDGYYFYVNPETLVPENKKE